MTLNEPRSCLPAPPSFVRRCGELIRRAHPSRCRSGSAWVAAPATRRQHDRRGARCWAGNQPTRELAIRAGRAA